MYKKDEPPFFVLHRYTKLLGMPIDLNKENIAEELQNLAIKHFQKFPFHTLNFNLKNKKSSEIQDMPLLLDRNALIHQLVDECGGSCYHHNAVFQAILEKNEIDSWFVSGLVNIPTNPQETFKFPTHVAIIFKYKDTEYLFDPGWLGTSFPIYPLPSITDSVIQRNNYQLKKSNNSEFPFTFEEIRQDGSTVPKYTFSNKPTHLESFNEAIKLLNSKEHEFYNLFLFTQINEQQHLIRFVNRYLIIQDVSGKRILEEKLQEDVSIIHKLTELLESHTGDISALNTDDFKNSVLGDLVCQKPALIQTAKIL